MKLKKILKIVLGVIAALLLLITLTVLFWLGPTLKLVAQTIGPKALGTELHIEKLKINPIKGSIHLSDFSIKNPDMFGQSNAVSVASLNISVDMASLFTSTVVVHQVEINSPYMIYEQDLSSDNITEFIRNVQKFAKIDPAAPPKPKKEKKKKKDAEPKAPVVVIVESLSINDVQLNLANTHDEKLDIGVGFEQLTISMTNGTARLDNLYVNNPKRLNTEHLFTLDTVDIHMDPGSIYSTNIHFEAIEILNPHAFIEHNPETDTLGEFLKIASSLVSKIPTNAPKTTATNEVAAAEIEEDPKAPPTTITLDNFLVDDVQLHSVNIGDPQLDVVLGFSRFSLAIDRGTLKFERLFLSNPACFTTPDLFSLDEFSIQIAPGSHLQDTVVIEDIQVIKPNVFLELNPESDTVSEFLKIANGYLDRIPSYEIPQLPPAPEKPEAEDPVPSVAPATNAPPAFELHNLLVDDLELHLMDRSDTNTPNAQLQLIAGIDEVTLKLFEGQLHINNIRVPNAEQFTASNLFHIAGIDVAIEPGSIHTDQFIINKVLIDSPNINLEQTVDSGNVATLQTTLMKFAPEPEELPKLAMAQPATEQPAPTETTNAPIPLAEQPFVLHQLITTNFAVHLLFPESTNQTAGGFSDSLTGGMQKLNPMKLASSGRATETAEAKNGQMTILAFSNLSLEPLKGLLYIDNLHISNPPDFSRNDLIHLEHFRIDLDPDTLHADTLHIEDILIAKPHIRYERQITSDNIKALQAEIEQAVMRRGEIMNESTNAVAVVDELPKEAVTEQTDPPSNEQKVIIDRVLLTGISVRAKLSALPAIPVPPFKIEMKDLGKDEGGTSLADAGNKIFNSLYDSIIKAVSNTTGFAGDTLKGLGGLTFDALGGVTGGISNMAGFGKHDEEKAEEKKEEKKKRRRKAGGRRSIF